MVIEAADIASTSLEESTHLYWCSAQPPPHLGRCYCGKLRGNCIVRLMYVENPSPLLSTSTGRCSLIAARSASKSVVGN